MIICCSCAIRGASSGDSCSASATSGKPISSLSTASSTCSSSLSSPGCLNTSSFPLINRLFFNGASCPASLPSPFSDSFPFALSFFFCRFARFLAVLASAAPSASFRLLSNSAVSTSYQTRQLTLLFTARPPTCRASSSIIFNRSYSLRLLAL